MDRSISELGRNNRTAMVAHITSVLAIVVFEMISLFQANRSIALFLLDIVLGFAPVIAESYFYKKDNDTQMVRHFTAIGFAAYYAYIMLTASTYKVYVFAIPIIFVMTVFHDTKLLIQINTGSVIIQIIVVFLGFNTGRYGYSALNDGIIQIFSMAMVAIFAHWSAKNVYENTSEKIEEALKANELSEKMIVEIKALSDRMSEGIVYANKDLLSVKEAADFTKDAMKELSSGAAQTAQSVLEQTHLTEQIQLKVDHVTESSVDMINKMMDTTKVIAIGREHLKNLAEQVDSSVEDGARVTEKLETLNSYVDEMHSIVKIISGIANQTSMLALNASIEAARAGEAGRGFAVVAGQVTNMAGQTQDATVKISDLIEAVAQAIKEVIEVIQGMISDIEIEKDSSEKTVESFDNIRINVNEVKDEMQELTKNVEELQKANRDIVDSTTTISTISQEFMAQTNETAKSQEETVKVINGIVDNMKTLLAFINK